jgi:pyrimidine operon attenuation protein / uracil phosphoribosyltransferase
MVKEKSLILNEAQIKQKIRRIAFEILEQNFQATELVIAGIVDNGYVLASLLAKELKKISHYTIREVKVQVDKSAPSQSEVLLNCPPESLSGAVIILVDDVMNTGRTTAYSLKPFLQVPVKKIEIAVLVNRDHTEFPISCQYTGYELSTTLNEHVEVVLSKGEMGVYLH